MGFYVTTFQGTIATVSHFNTCSRWISCSKITGPQNLVHGRERFTLPPHDENTPSHGTTTAAAVPALSNEPALPPPAVNQLRPASSRQADGSQSLKDSNNRSAPASRNGPLSNRGSGMATTNIPAALADRTPDRASSKARHSSGFTPIRLAAAR